MAIKNGVPGPKYELGKVYNNGPSKKLGIGFNKVDPTILEPACALSLINHWVIQDHRKPLNDNYKSRTDACYLLPPPKPRSITIGRKIKDSRLDVRRQCFLIPCTSAWNS